MAYTYFGLQALALLAPLSIYGFLIIFAKPSPPQSSYPLVDFAARSIQSSSPTSSSSSGRSLAHELSSLSGASNHRVHDALGGVKFYLRANRGRYGHGSKVPDLVDDTNSPVSLTLVSGDGKWLENLGVGMKCF